MNVFWSDIESRFFKLHSEQRSANGLVHAINSDDSWTLGGPEDLQKKFRSIVRNIAVRLGWANDKDPLSAWCELLKRHGVGYHKMTGSINRRRVELDTEQMCSIEREQRDTQGGTINLLCKVSAEYCIECDTKEAAAAKATAVGRQIFVAENSGKTAQGMDSKSTKEPTAIARNINRLRKECGWSLDDLSKETGIGKKLILSHVNKGATPRPRILKEYAQAFSKALRRSITAPDLEK